MSEQYQDDRYKLGQFRTGSLFIDAIKAGDAQAVKSLLESKQGSVEKGTAAFSPLALAALNNQVEVGRVLLSYGADVNARSNPSRSTALMWSNSPEFSQLLIDKGAKLFLRDKFGNTAQKRAKEFNNQEIVELLKDASNKQRHEIGTVRWLAQKVLSF